MLVGAGVGFTPMLSMLHATRHHDRPLWYVHGTSDGDHHALRHEVDALVAANPRAVQHVAYSRPGRDDVHGRDYHARGRITAASLLGLGAGSQAHYLLCGPPSFLADIRNGLEAAGVPPRMIHSETFGPAG
ncbi:hypothetical protein [Paracoccus indicus]|uniref:hypothetical protein n=1 Tax=Paracoccus indicus TaxID=2079229 RepID=UPI001FE54B59|nr:hypothetical protein [Paracoccus indicus]